MTILLLLLAGSLFLLALCMLVTILVYYRMDSSRNRLRQQWLVVHAWLRRRQAIVAKLVSLGSLTDPAGQEKLKALAVAEQKAASVDIDDVVGRSAAEVEMEELLAGIMQQLQAVPIAHGPLQLALSDLEEAQSHIPEEINLFNAEVEEYNRFIQLYGAYHLARWMGYLPMPSYPRYTPVTVIAATANLSEEFPV